MTERWKRAAFATAGWLFVGLAVAGVVLPLLPTTPFVLLASSCFIRSSPRTRKWLLNSRLFGPSLHDWEEHRAVRKPVKVLAVVVITIALTLVFFRNIAMPIRIATLAIGLIGLVVVLRLPTRPPEVSQPVDA